MSDNIPFVIYVILELLIAAFSVVGNVLVCWAVCLNSNLQSITNFFVVSLAVADIAVGVLAIPFSVVISIGFCSNFYGCLFIACFVLVLTQSSIFSLLAIAIDRYIAIKMPLRYSSLVTGQRAQGIIAICWVFSIVIGLTPMMGWYKVKTNSTNTNNTNSTNITDSINYTNNTNYTDSTNFTVSINYTNNTESESDTCPLQGLMKCEFEQVVDMSYMVYFNFFGCVLIPLLMMLVIYLRIFMAARHQLKLMEVKVIHGEKSRSMAKEVQAAKSLAIIVGLFAICWLPLHIINCFTHFCPDCGRAPILIMYIAIILSHANSVINPFIYAYRIREFRQTFRKIIRHHILRQELFESGRRMSDSAYTSITDSIRLKANSLSHKFFSEHSHHPPNMSQVGGGLVAVSNPPLAVVISHCPQMGPCPLLALRHAQIPAGLPVQQSADCISLEELEEDDKQTTSPCHVSSLFNKQSRETKSPEASGEVLIQS
ncbi:uncharacterized protein V6R79_009347 [Siganus canaliculatus]